MLPYNGWTRKFGGVLIDQGDVDQLGDHSSVHDFVEIRPHYQAAGEEVVASF